MSVETPNSPNVKTKPVAHLPAIQSLRGIAVLLVILAHLVIIESKYSPDAILGDWAFLGMAGVDLFFVISGFIMVYVTQTVIPGRTAPLPFLWRRLTRIYPLYWIVSLAVLVVFLVRPDVVNSSAVEPDMARSFLLYPQTGVPLLAVGWTLVHELYFYLIFGLMLVFARRWLVPLLGLWALAIAAAMVGDIGEGPVRALASNPLTYEFIGGCLLGVIFIERKLSMSVGVALILVGIAASIAAILFYNCTANGIVLIEVYRSILFGLPSLALLVTALLFPSRFSGRPFVALGDMSYSLYLTHVLSLSLAGRIWQTFSRDGWFDNLVMLVALIAFAILIGQLTYIFIERPLIQYFRRRRSPRDVTSVAHL